MVTADETFELTLEQAKFVHKTVGMLITLWGKKAVKGSVVTLHDDLEGWLKRQE